MTIDSRFYELINHLWRGGSYALFWTSNDGNGQKVSYWLTLPNTDEVPKFLLTLDAYFGVHPSNIRRSEHERAHITDIDAVNTFYVEYDCKSDDEKKTALEKIANLPIQPACVVDSGGGYHCYFWLRDTYHLSTLDKRQRIADLQWAFVQWAGGDSSVNDLARVLRIPGTVNHKPRFAPNFPSVCIVRWDTTQQLEIVDLEPFLQPLIEQRVVKIHAVPPKTNTVLTVNDDKLLAILFRNKNGANYQRLWDGDLSVCGGDHSKCDQYLCDGLAWVTARDVSRMDSMFRQSGLMRDKWNRDDYRKTTLENAANSAYTEYDPFRGIDPEAIAAVEAMINNE